MPHSSPPSSGKNWPFNIVFIKGNISVCSGCKQRFIRKPSGNVCDPPHDVVIQHWEDRPFTSPRTGLPTSKRGNAYYHVHGPCIKINWPNFTSVQISIDPAILSELTVEHKALLFNGLGIDLA